MRRLIAAMATAAALTACGGPATSDDSLLCDGADLVDDFSEGPGQIGRVCVFWSDGRNQTIRLRMNADGRWERVH